MVKIKEERLLPPDHPMFTGGVEMFTVRKPKKSKKTSAKNPSGKKSAKSRASKQTGDDRIAKKP